LGAHALEATTTGEGNSAVGYAALMKNTTGYTNVSIGQNTLKENTTGTGNTALGYAAGDVITTGGQNVIIGSGADPSTNSASNQIVIGYGADGIGNNYAVIGNSDITRVYAAEDVGATLYAGSATVQTSSDRRIKENIQDLDYGLNFINKLRPVSWNKKRPVDYPQELKEILYPDKDYREVTDEEHDRRRVGFIAQEVQSVMKEMSLEGDIVEHDETTTINFIAYSKIIAPLVLAVQELSTELEEQKEEIAELKEQNTRLNSVLSNSDYSEINQ